MKKGFMIFSSKLKYMSNLCANRSIEYQRVSYWELNTQVLLWLGGVELISQWIDNLAINK